jgi:hypothetical protein
MINAIRFPFKILPLKDNVCSKDAVTKEINDFPSAFMANNISNTRSVNAPIPR